MSADSIEDIQRSYMHSYMSAMGRKGGTGCSTAKRAALAESRDKRGAKRAARLAAVVPPVVAPEPTAPVAEALEPEPERIVIERGADDIPVVVFDF